MADIKEIMEQAGTAAKKVAKSPFFLAACGVGIIALVWDSGNRSTGSTETVTFSEATGYEGYPDVSGDVSTLANNMSAAMQDMYDAMTESNALMQQQMQDSYLQMQEQTAEQFEQMNTVIDNKISNMEFVQRESIQAYEDYNYGLMESVSSLSAQLNQAQADAAAAKAEAEAAKQSAADALKKASTTTTTTTKKTSSSSAAKSTGSSTYTYKTKSGYNTSTSIVDAIKVATGDYSSPDLKAIAAANGIKNYTGTAAQNVQMLNSLKAGTLKKA